MLLGKNNMIIGMAFLKNKIFGRMVSKLTLITMKVMNGGKNKKTMLLQIKHHGKLKKMNLLKKFKNGH